MSRTAIRTKRTEAVTFARSNDEAFLTALCTPNYGKEIILTDTRDEQEQCLKAQVQKLNFYDEILQLQSSRLGERSSLLKPSEIIQTYRLLNNLPSTLRPHIPDRRSEIQKQKDRFTRAVESVPSGPRTASIAHLEPHNNFERRIERLFAEQHERVEVGANDAAFNTHVQQYGQLDEGIRNFKRVIQGNA